MARERRAAEQASFQQSLAKLTEAADYLKPLLARLDRITPLPRGSNIAEIGSAQGHMLICLNSMGYHVTGVEPWDQARKVAAQLADHQGSEVAILKGVAESLPMEPESFDALIAKSVIEHVNDAEAAFAEAARVLKPGGVFWFSTASSMCPKQDKVSGFPLFGWYPNSLKLRIMEWAKSKRPHLIGHAAAPPINWFTPFKARRMLRKAGFSRIYDRYDLRLPNGGGKKYRAALAVVSSCRLTKLIGDILWSGCSYAAVK